MGDARHTLTSRRRTRGALLGAMNPPRDRTAVRPTSTFAGAEYCRHGPFPSAVRTWRGRAPRSAVLRCDHEGDARRSGASFCARADALDRRLCMVAPSRRLLSGAGDHSGCAATMPFGVPACECCGAPSGTYTSGTTQIVRSVYRDGSERLLTCRLAMKYAMTRMTYEVR